MPFGPSFVRPSSTLVGATVVFLAAACGGVESEGPAAKAGTACLDAFERAAQVGDMQDTVEDLDPAVRACKSLQEWKAADQAHPGALDGTDPETFLRNRCRYGDFGQAPSLCERLDLS